MASIFLYILLLYFVQSEYISYEITIFPTMRMHYLRFTLTKSYNAVNSLTITTLYIVTRQLYHSLHLVNFALSLIAVVRRMFRGFILFFVWKMRKQLLTLVLVDSTSVVCRFKSEIMKILILKTKLDKVNQCTM